MAWECEVCYRSFASAYARHQHYSDARDHPYCAPCRRVFGSYNNLMQVRGAQPVFSEKKANMYVSINIPASTLVTKCNVHFVRDRSPPLLA